MFGACLDSSPAYLDPNILSLQKTEGVDTAFSRRVRRSVLAFFKPKKTKNMEMGVNSISTISVNSTKRKNYAIVEMWVLDVFFVVVAVPSLVLRNPS